jgi:hypothetical protein
VRAARRSPVLALGLLLALLVPASAAAKPSPTPFSIEPGSFKVTPSTFKAGAHPDMTIAFGFSRDEADEKPFNDVKSTFIDLPAGIAGSPKTVPTCATAQLLVEGFSPECPLDSQVGTVSVDFTFGGADPGRFTLPLYNMAGTGPEAPAVLGFRVAVFSQLVPMSIRPGDGGLSVGVENIPLAAEPSRISLTIWGVPASPVHDPQRGQVCLPEDIVGGEESCSGGGSPASLPPRPFLDNPTRCGPAIAKLEVNSWEEPESWSKAETDAGPFVDCASVPFQPSVEIKTTSAAAESPTGLDLTVLVPQDREGPDSITSSSLARVAVALPEGLTINPARPPGVCSQEEFEREAPVPPPNGCPLGSMLGTAEVESPLLDEAAVGSIYMAKPFDNPFGTLFGLYLVARAPASGVVVRLPGRLLPDPATGRLRLGFEQIPQLPLSRIALHLPQRSDSLLVTPPACGQHAAEAELTPSSAPSAPRHEVDHIAIGTGPQGTPCPTGTRLTPSLTIATPRTAAGAFAPLQLSLRREDGEAQISRLSLRLPPGLVADLATVPPCPDAALAAAAARTGAEERANPSCPASSTVGHALVGTGVGPQLGWVSGSVYLAGRHRGATLSLALVAPAVLGPFDLGTVVVREPVRVSRGTGEIVVGSRRSDPFPTVLSGVPLRLRELNLYMDRARFLRNPTGCAPLSAKAILTGTAGFVAGPEVSATQPLPFRATGCDRLRFAPRLRLQLLGGVHRNGHPGLRIALASRRGEAGLAAAEITLPHIALLDLGHVRGICTPRKLRERSCPADSVYGFAKVVTPFLREPLRGPVHLRSTRGGLPSLVAALRNRQMEFDLAARLEAVRGGIRIAPEDVPDLPLSKLVLRMRGGRDGLVVNSVDLCTDRRHAIARLHAHSGKQLELRPRLFVACRSRDREGSGRGVGAPEPRER